MGGRVLELFSKDEEEAMLNSLSEEMLEGVKTPGGSKSADELRELFLKVSRDSTLCSEGFMHTTQPSIMYKYCIYIIL